MIYFLLAICLINTFASVYFGAILHERSIRNARDINAIAARLRILEDTSQVLQVAYDFRIKVVEHRIFDNRDTGFNLDNVPPHKE